MPTVDTAFVYPGGCLIEGTNLSEGRGTTRPFELVGAPWLDAWRLWRSWSARAARRAFRPVFFEPTFQKHAGRVCGGVQVHVTDRRRFPAYLAYLLLIHHARRLDPGALRLARPALRIRVPRRPLDVLCGTDRVRLALEAGVSPKKLAPGWAKETAAFKKRRARFLMY